jgi:hypothetical protein
MNATATAPSTTPGTDLLPFDEGALDALEGKAIEFRTGSEKAPPFKRAFLVAEAMRQLREMITPEMLASIQAGEGQALGFKTDKWKDGKQYPVEVIRDVTIEATLRGVSMVNNEVNIISSGFYMAKNGCKRRVREWPGLSGLQVALGVPELKGGEALVSVRSVYWIDDREHRFDRTEKKLEGGGTFDNRLAIRVNAGQGSDAILGKAERKFFAALLEHLSGEPVPTGDVGEDTLDAESSPTKPKRSTLFDDERDEPEDSGPDEAAQAGLVGEYMDRLGECQNKNQVGAVAKQAGGDKRLVTESRKTIMDGCTARRKEV